MAARSPESRPAGRRPRRRLVPLAVAILSTCALLALVLLGCGATPAAVDSPSAAAISPAASPAPGGAAIAPLRRLFAYDSAEPLELKVTGSRTVDGVTVRDVTFRGHEAEVTGVLSVPAGPGPFAAVLYAPGVGCPAMMFEPDMAALQRAGIAALAVDPPDGRRPSVDPISLDAATVAAAHVQYVRDLRRGLDLLASLPEVDAGRIGYVGYSWGGYVGGLLAGVRAPVKAYVITYAGADWVSADPTGSSGFPDPAAAIAAGRGASYLFQAGVDDPLFSRTSVRRYYDATRGSKRLQWFPGGHGDLWSMPSGAAIESHREWLTKNL